jgi:hypothetical protein
MALPFNLPPTLFSSMASPMNQPYAPMYQPPPQTGVSSVIERLQSGMGEDYTSRLLSNLNLPSASQFAAMAPPQQPAFNPYAQMVNPYAGMFESLLARIAQLEGAQGSRLTPDGREQFDPNRPSVMATQPGTGKPFGAIGAILDILGLTDKPTTTTDDAYSSGDGGTMSASQAASAAAADTEYGPSF